MRNWPLSIQIWLVFAAITLIISLVLSLVFPWTLRNFFTQEIYATIEESQISLLHFYPSGYAEERGLGAFMAERRQQRQGLRTISHFIIAPDRDNVFPAVPLPSSFLDQVIAEARTQTTTSQRYSNDIEDEKIFYVITRSELGRQNVYLVSYMWDTYREDLVQTLFKQILLIMFLVFLISWIPSLALARYVSHPLITLEKKVKKLSLRDWHEPLHLQRGDEIGKLGNSIEQLRRQLIAQDEAQQSFLQHISHELKTPVMVIRSYIQAIKDGIYPKGDLAETTRVIESEAERLEQGIQNLLYLTKLDYLSTRQPDYEPVSLDRLICGVVERFRWQRPELDWTLQLSALEILGDREQLQVMLENLLDNQLRYAAQRIRITLNPSREREISSVLLHIWNDGPPIEEKMLGVMLDKFTKGSRGKMGLGLSIVKGIVHLHQGKITVQNKNNGVSFDIHFPLPQHLKPLE